MSYKYGLLGNLILLFLIQCTVSILRSPERNRRLSILHFNDAYDIERSPAFAYQFLERDSGRTLKLFSGDIFSPSIVSIFQKGKQFQTLLKYLQLSAAVVGNHEFDFGEDWFLYLKSLNNLDWLAGNLKNRKTKASVGNLEEYKIMSMGSITVGIFGLVDQDWLTSSGLTPEEFELEDVKKAGRRLSKLLYNKKVDIVIALTHMLNESDRILLNDPKNYVNIVLGGHDHIYYVELSNNRLLLKSGCNFDHFSHIKIEFRDTPSKYVTNTEPTFSFLLDSGKNENDYHSFSFSLENKSYGGYLNVQVEKVIVDQNGDKDPTMAQYINEAIEPLTHSYSRPIFYLSTELETRGQIIRHQESGICDFVADLVHINADADISVLSAGGFRLEREVPKDSVLTYLDAIHLLPFSEEIVVFLFTGNEVLQMLEEGIEAIQKGNTFIVVSGVSAQFDPEKPISKRLLRDTVLINGRLLEETATYRIATTSYLAKGKEGFHIFASYKKQKFVLENLSSLTCIKNLWEMATNLDYISEFKVFRNNFYGMTVEDLLTIQNTQGLTKVYYSLEEHLLLHENNEALLSKMSQTAFKRLLIYTLLDGVKKIQGIEIFSVNLQKKKDRIFPVTMQDL